MNLSNTPGGFGKDLRRLKTEGTASAGELREFLSQLRGKSTQEVLGVVAQSQLTRSLVLATVGCAVLLVVFTVIPYLLRDTETAHAQPAQPAAAAAEPAAATPDAAATTAARAGDAQAAPPAAPPSREHEALQRMEMSEAREAPLDQNPLEDKLDDLLDGVE